MIWVIRYGTYYLEMVDVDDEFTEAVLAEMYPQHIYFYAELTPIED